MGFGIYIKSGKNKDGRSPLFIKITSQEKVFKKNIGLLIKKEDWNARTYQVKRGSVGSAQVNRKLNAFISKAKEAWVLFESGAYEWEELCARMSGGDSKADVMGFIEDVFKPKMKLTSYNSYKYSLLAFMKVLGLKSVSFNDLNFSKIDKAVGLWKLNNLSGSSIETYLKHIGVIVNEAYERKLIGEPFKKKAKWRVKKTDNIIETATSAELLENVKNVNDIYDYQTFAFWLLMFSMRGLYPRDFDQMHQHEQIIDCKTGAKRYVKHRRSKTGELMTILISLDPIEEIWNAIKGSLYYTHKGNAKVYPKEWRALQFFEYDEKDHRNVWDVYTKRSRKVVGFPFKVARKTFETYALKLDVSTEVRYRLLGHQDRTIKKNYQNWEWDDMVEIVDKAHLKVMDEFEINKIWFALRRQACIKKLPAILFNKAIPLNV
ncbi:phage integrase SAM-like domain-containing protein [Flavobacteriaceae bacterium]|nr:phage integrase SAM-like domain-containing protein [Flavobacteriaceae bacterium]